MLTALLQVLGVVMTALVGYWFVAGLMARLRRIPPTRCTRHEYRNSRTCEDCRTEYRYAVYVICWPVGLVLDAGRTVFKGAGRVLDTAYRLGSGEPPDQEES